MEGLVARSPLNDWHFQLFKQSFDLADEAGSFGQEPLPERGFHP